jgi:hypothetical protein
MNFRIIFIGFLCVFVSNCEKNQTTKSNDDNFEKEFNHADDDYSEFNNSTEKVSNKTDKTTTKNAVNSTIATTEAPYFSEIPDKMKIVYIDPISLIRADNHGEKMMGIADDKCDNGRVSSVKFDGI